MTHPKKLHIGMTLAPTWLSGEAWRRDDSGIENLSDPNYLVDIAKRAEAAKLDFVFRPDSLGQPPATLGRRRGAGACDPTLFMAKLAAATTHIGLLTTASTTFFPPYILARMIMSLHWLSEGRAGWNIVTSLDGHKNFGLDQMPSAETRYAQAAESVAVIKSLWETCASIPGVDDDHWSTAAISAPAAPINHDGDFYRVEGPLSCATHPSPLPLFQAGASDSGRNFAASVAHGTFAACPDKQVAIDLRADLNRRAKAQGRGPIRVLPGLSLFLAESEAEAKDLHRATHAGTTRQQKIAKLKAMTGLDLAMMEDSRKITETDLGPLPATIRSRTHAELLYRKIIQSEPTVKELLDAPELIGSAHWQVIGTVGPCHGCPFAIGPIAMR